MSSAVQSNQRGKLYFTSPETETDRGLFYNKPCRGEIPKLYRVCGKVETLLAALHSTPE